MLFNSYSFILIFLPIVIGGFYIFSRTDDRRSMVAFLTLSSLVFYGWWNPKYLLLILISILVNFFISCKIRPDSPLSRPWLWIGVAFNLGLLGYFKYANFFVDVAASVSGMPWHISGIVLPLAISFFTFQQIAYLVDTFRGDGTDQSFMDYCLFVTFFPQLIAGPIVHHKEMMPQFMDPQRFRFAASNLGLGLSVFFAGLFKKVIIADSMALYATPVFQAAETGVPIGLIDGWGAALSYTFQLYFDFSGYTDMATGLALMFGIRLPVNFLSPYKAASIIDFWRRWHMTLSRFLRDYLYIPLGGNRQGPGRRMANLMLTMILGGLWHGAGWTFVLWGALHGIYLMINTLWRAILQRAEITLLDGLIGRGLGRLLTFLAVVVAWVLFRAESLDGATNVLAGMIGAHGLHMPSVLAELKWDEAYRQIALLLVIVWLAPNTVEVFATGTPSPSASSADAGPPPGRFSLRWRPNRRCAYTIALIAVAALANMTEISEFLYFRF